MWKQSLGATPDSDIEAQSVERLRSRYLDLRKAVSELVQPIAHECHGLTVHDVTHLDALWETADLLAGPDYPLNPAEGFVLGAAILLHDAAMSVAAYPGRMNEIKQTPQWSDAVHLAYRRQGVTKPSPDQLRDPSADIQRDALFDTLRSLHAAQAEKLINLQFYKNKHDSGFHILDDTELRESLGTSIGKIAHSHHWNPESLLTLQPEKGTSPDLPPEWSINEIKLACLLRCADAAHIDKRRAPNILYATIRPRGLSALHWKFQNKLNQATHRNGDLIYSSGVPFDIEDSDSWWLCYELIQLIDKEIRSCNAILRDIGEPEFRIQRVVGAESPRALSKRIEVRNWQPVNAEIRVSDAQTLVKTLGGENLYGNDPFVPVREIIQNAVDAIRARRKRQDLDALWGTINISVKPQHDSDQLIEITIEDNGVGMTERVMTGPLLDFGKSIWNSTLLHEEFPGLESSGLETIGRFGIGFFSVFIFNNRVSITSKPYDGGKDDVHVMEFSSVSGRPIIRNGDITDLSPNFSTKICFNVDVSNVAPRSLREVGSLRKHGLWLKERITQLIAPLDIAVNLYLGEKQERLHHAPDWQNLDSHTFLKELIPSLNSLELNGDLELFGSLLSPIRSEDGTVIGRAALASAVPKRDRYGERYSFVSVGGLAYPFSGFVRQSKGLEYCGVITGAAADITRRYAVVDISDTILQEWVTDQVSKIDSKKFTTSQLTRLAQHVVSMNSDSGDLPFCFFNGAFISYREFYETLERAEELIFLLERTYGDNYKLLNTAAIPFDFIRLGVNKSIIIFFTGTEYSGELFDKEKAKELNVYGMANLEWDDIQQDVRRMVIFDLIEKVWGPFSVQMWSGSVYECELFSVRDRVGLKLARLSS